MKIRQIMDCIFTVCSYRDTVASAMQKMALERNSFAIVADEKNTYIGMVTAASLFPHLANGEMPVETLIEGIEPAQENGGITSLKTVNAETLPVVNSEKNVVGVINLKSLIEYLPEVMNSFDSQRSGLGRKDQQLSAKYTINDIIGQSGRILSLKERILAAAKTKSTVLIMGETGTGKELVAHAIHRLSSRRHNAFVRVNCAAIPDSLLESELFGYEQGSFTGAVKGGHIGKFEIADGGTIFLDEIGDMPFSLQSKILRVLQEKEIEKIGGRAPIPVDIRIIAATHRNLLDLVKENKFRQDLYYRLHVIPVDMPPLRSHREDIPLLVDYFLEKQAEELGIHKPKVERNFLTALLEYDWPGNVRELSNMMEFCLSISHGVLTAEQVPGYLLAGEAAGQTGDDAAYLKSRADEAEKEAILEALDMYQGNKIKVADVLGISRSSLYNKLKKYNIDA